MRATDFYAGQRVRLTALGQSRCIVQKRANGLGRVAHIYPHRPLAIRILPDGYRHGKDYSVNFWEPVDDAEKGNR